MKYDYLKDTKGKLITFSDGQDKYVELKVNNTLFSIPVSMPRRNPELQLDLIKPDKSVWDYLDGCAVQLTSENIEKWKEGLLPELEKKDTINN